MVIKTALDHSTATVETRQRSECLQGFCRKCFQAIILHPVMLPVQKENKNPFKTCKVLIKVKENLGSRKREFSHRSETVNSTG